MIKTPQFIYVKPNEIANKITNRRCKVCFVWWDTPTLHQMLRKIKCWRWLHCDLNITDECTKQLLVDFFTFPFWFFTHFVSKFKMKPKIIQNCKYISPPKFVRRATLFYEAFLYWWVIPLVHLAGVCIKKPKIPYGPLSPLLVNSEKSSEMVIRNPSFSLWNSSHRDHLTIFSDAYVIFKINCVFIMWNFSFDFFVLCRFHSSGEKNQEGRSCREVWYSLWCLAS